MNETIKIDTNFSMKDFEDMENIEHSYFPNENITKAEEVYRWYKKNNLTCVGLRNESDDVIASVNILPLKEKIFYDIYENRMNESNVTYDQIEKYEDGKTYYMYLSSISIDKEYRNNYRVITKLVKGCFELLELLEKRHIKIKMIMADASTIHGEKICTKLLKMDYIINTDHDSKIFVQDGDKFIENIEKIKIKFDKF